MSSSKYTPVINLLKLVLTLLLSVNAMNSVAQDSLINNQNKLIINFRDSTQELVKGQLVTNVLHIINQTNETKTFVYDILHPSEWTRLDDKLGYSLEQGDEIFIPIILIPKQISNTNTDIFINAYLLDEENQQIGNAYFSLYTKKEVSWDARSISSERIYLRNGEKNTTINYQIVNTGNFDQEIIFSTNALRNNIILKDSSGSRLITKQQIKLKRYEDTIFDISAEVLPFMERNFKKVSALTYQPSRLTEIEKFTLFLQTNEPKLKGENQYSRNSKIDILRLNSQKEVNQFGDNQLPLTVEANIQNVLSEFSFMNINARGFKQLNKDASLSYFAQLNYNESYWNSQSIMNSPWYVGYFDERKTIEIGNISGNINGINNFGKGFKVSYKYFENQKSTVYYLRNPTLVGPSQNESVGIEHESRINNNFKVIAKLGRNINRISGNEINAYSISPTFTINKNHSINLLATITDRQKIGLRNTEIGSLFGGSYSTNYLEKRANSSITFRFNDRKFSSGGFSRTIINQRTRYTINKKWNFFINNNYQKIDSRKQLNTSVPLQEYFFNNFFFSTTSKNGTWQPGGYYNVNNVRLNKTHSRGVSFRYATYNFKKNSLVSLLFKAGYNDPVDFIDIPNYFNFEFTSILRYKVWNITTRYHYGAQSIPELLNMREQNYTAQKLRLSANNQYQFKNPKYLFENTLSYNFTNRFNSHNIGLFPQIFYFTNNGYRFGLMVNYNLRSNNYSSLFDNYQNNSIGSSNDLGNVTQSTFNLSINIKKDFGIPLPFLKSTSSTAKFKVFYDLNGNGQYDENEISIENTVLRINEYEIITDENGEAGLTNLSFGTYQLGIISLDKIKGWFPEIEDSIEIFNSRVIYVPFVKGIKVIGEVNIDQQKISIADEKDQINLERIKITANGRSVYNTLTDSEGKFEFYLPVGRYTLTLDESILGDRFKLVENNIAITLTKNKEGLYSSFYILEKRRNINIKTF
ncbi:hypothetical protein OAB47_02165 [Vicingaceae bacterium]|nr:hypothetical protein [Vicingaceae bacterium]